MAEVIAQILADIEERGAVRPCHGLSEQNRKTRALLHPTIPVKVGPSQAIRG